MRVRSSGRAYRARPTSSRRVSSPEGGSPNGPTPAAFGSPRISDCATTRIGPTSYERVEGPVCGRRVRGTHEHMGPISRERVSRHWMSEWVEASGGDPRREGILNVIVLTDWVGSSP